ncbi:MAG: RnfABCDGE type electron transport complex subunit D [Clostridia bacterium]|nr:RnfABCDGE type electron transport complex subunit D [Clostridia bacterium]MBR3819583.1 RnfABCDGE type electron transport complex subunit D [Clostridia bacterium]
MVDGKKLVVSASPHLRTKDTTQRIMLDVVIALIPALIAAVVLFGPRVLAVTATTVITAVLSEFAARKVMKRHNTIQDLSAVVTGLILAFNLPVSIPLWMAAIGSFFAIVVVKQMFGGIGQNFANPAIVARIVLLLSFGQAMGNWTAPLSWKTDAVSTATPLAIIGGESTEALPSLLDMFLGIRGGCIGETCSLALIVGGIYLMARKVISYKIPVAFIGTVAVIMLIAGKFDLEFLAYELMGGGLLLGAFFMATDYSTSPIKSNAKIVFGVGCGLLTCVIRLFASLPEGVSFAILIMNLLVPHIETIMAPKPFGTVKEKKTKEGEAK